MKILLALLISFFFIGCEGSSKKTVSSFNNPGQISVKVVSEDEKHNSSQSRDSSNSHASNNSNQSTALSSTSGENESSQNGDSSHSNSRSSQKMMASDVSESNQNTHSSNADKGSEQTKYYLGSEGIVRVVGLLYFPTDVEVVTTGFFVDPHTVVTNYHAVNKFKGEVSKNIFIVHPETKQLIPVQSIRALDIENDLAVLHISKYESPFYYGEELFAKSLKSVSNSHAYIFDHNKKLTPKLEGPLSLNSFEQSFSLFSVYEIENRVSGFSGSPVFSTDGKVIGVLTQDQLVLFYTQFGFTDIQKVKKILSKSPLNCVSDKCIKEEVDSIQSKEAQYLKGVLDTALRDTIQQYANPNDKQKLLSEINPYVWFKKSADQGYAPAMYGLATFYLRQVSKPNLEMVDHWIEKSSQHNYGLAQLHWGRNLLMFDRDYFEEGMKLVQKAHTKGYFTPVNILYHLFTQNIMTSEEYFYYLEDFANKGNPDAQMTLAYNLLTNKNLNRNKEAIQFLLKAAEVNYPPAVEQLARIYEQGLYGEEQNVEKANNLKQKAIELSSPLSFQ